MMVFDYLKNYETFNTVAEMDEAVAQHLAANDLTDSERNIILRIAQSALAYPGAAHLKAKTIADSVGISTKTVYRAVKKAAELGIIRVVASTKLNGIKGANIYQILHVPSEMSERVPAEEVNEIAGIDNFSEQQTISFNLFKTSSLHEIYKYTVDQMNEWQKILYEFMKSLPINDELKDGLRAAILATPIQNKREFTIAKDAMWRIIQDIHEGKLSIRTTLRAIYKGAYEKAITRPVIREVVEQQQSTRPVPFYDWLTER
ncbi:helix-turn-helix domain-containing protein [Solibacillus merdavium]|uniref:Helix-turn-helix domain-containing protein n=1 Tax=Solibacillus merdavium TaxID=2762218 RepID=A0ABR8XM10_9BACL|nr:helix-turn-helix domain-containing protein [Solibacillus merdavium]MBD8032982.1 helix-turn-helix domain-containing protein [Solibacillus merdavium]